MADPTYMVQYIPKDFDDGGPYPEESYISLPDALEAVGELIDDGYKPHMIFLYKELRVDIETVTITKTKVFLKEGQTDV